MKIFLVLVVAAAISIGGCSPFRLVTDVSKLKANQRVLIGNVVLRDGKLSDWVRGLGASGQVTFSERLERSGLRPGLHGEVGGARLTDTGGVFRVGAAADRSIYVMSISVQSIYVLSNVSTDLPLLLKIAPSTNQCDYVGTLWVEKEGDRIVTEIVDTYERDKAAFENQVAGCKLGKNLAVPLTPEEIAAGLAVRR